MKKIMAAAMSIVALSASGEYFMDYPNYHYSTNQFCEFKEGDIYYQVMLQDSSTVAVWHNATDHSELDIVVSSEPRTVYTGDVVIPEFVEHNGKRFKVVTIGHHAFANNTQLRSVTLPPSVTCIGRYAFKNCTALESINITDNISVICEYAFRNTPQLSDFPLPSGLLNLEYEGISNYPYDEYIVPNSVSMVSFLPNASRIVFGKYEIKDKFDDYTVNFLCRGGTHNNKPFKDSGGPRLKEIVLPSPYIRMFAYSVSNSSLERIVLPETDEMIIWEPAFAQCPSLKEFVSMSTIPPLCNVYYGQSLDSEKGFGWLDDYSGVTLVVPEGSEEAYAADQVWGRFQTIKGDPEIGRYLLSANERISADRTEHGFTVSAESGALTVSAPEPTEIEIFTPTGVCVKRLTVTDETRIPLHGGIYLITDHHSTKKIFVSHLSY